MRNDAKITTPLMKRRNGVMTDYEYLFSMNLQAKGWSLDDIMQKNIDKLKARYPEGFETDKSLHRAEGDI